MHDRTNFCYGETLLLPTRRCSLKNINNICFNKKALLVMNIKNQSFLLLVFACLLVKKKFTIILQHKLNKLYKLYNNIISLFWPEDFSFKVPHLLMKKLYFLQRTFIHPNIHLLELADIALIAPFVRQ